MSKLLIALSLPMWDHIFLLLSYIENFWNMFYLISTFLDYSSVLSYYYAQKIKFVPRDFNYSESFYRKEAIQIPKGEIVKLIVHIQFNIILENNSKNTAWTPVQIFRFSQFYRPFNRLEFWRWIQRGFRSRNTTVKLSLYFN